jgi:hypothetical protein
MRLSKLHEDRVFMKACLPQVSATAEIRAKAREKQLCWLRAPWYAR